MVEIPDSLRALYTSEVERDGDRYVLSVPADLVETEGVSANETYRVALLRGDDESESGDVDERAPSATEEQADDETRGGGDRGHRGRQRQRQRPPVEEGETRSVTIDTLGDKGDGIAKIDRGFVVIVPGTKPGDRVDVEITDVKDTVAFADPISDAVVR